METRLRQVFSGLIGTTLESAGIGADEYIIGDEPIEDPPDIMAFALDKTFGAELDATHTGMYVENSRIAKDSIIFS